MTTLTGSAPKDVTSLDYSIRHRDGANWQSLPVATLDIYESAVPTKDV